MTSESVVETEFPDPSEEAASAKVWSVYVSEAEKYDRSLVESWKSDMEGTLIFAGLFSAILTAFIIESYKSLVPDSGDSTVQLLTQISQQLAAAANGSVSSTLVEQWARDFLHRAEMRSSPVIRARIFSFLYYGLKRFGMHTVVDMIPLFLHISLVVFFAGLIAFLIPINMVMAGLVALILCIVVFVYSMLTVLPIWHLDCPYSTPFSNICWHILLALSALRRRRYESGNQVKADPSQLTIVEAVVQRAMDNSDALVARDNRALAWTLKSLADDTELESFVEGIHDILWAPDGQRSRYAVHIHRLMSAPDLKLLSRIVGLLRSCDSGLLAEQDSRRRRITCFKAMWVLGSLPNLFPSLGDDGLLEHFYSSYGMISFIPHWEQWMRHYSIPVDALMSWNAFRQTKRHFVQAERDIKAGRTPNLHPIKDILFSWQPMGFLPQPTIQNIQAPLYALSGAANNLVEFSYSAQQWRTMVSYLHLFHFLRSSGIHLDSLPYRWGETIHILTPASPFSAFTDLAEFLELAIHSVVFSHLDELGSENHRWALDIIRPLCMYWTPSEPRRIPSAIIKFLNHPSQLSHNTLLPTFHATLWPSFPITLSEGTSTPEALELYWGSSRRSRPDEILGAIWRLCCAGFGPPVSLYRGVLQAVIAQAESSPMTFSVIGIIKTGILKKLADSILNPFHLTSAWITLGPETFELFPTETAISSADAADPSDAARSVYDRIIEAEICLLAELMESCTEYFVPYKCVDLLRAMGSAAPQGRIHPRHQLRFANATYRLSNQSKHPETLETLVGCEIFNIYAAESTSGIDSRQTPTFWLHQEPFDDTAPFCDWLDDVLAREKTRRALEIYSATLTHGPVLARTKAIVQSLQTPPLNQQ